MEVFKHSCQLDGQLKTKLYSLQSSMLVNINWTNYVSSQGIKKGAITFEDKGPSLRTPEDWFNFVVREYAKKTPREVELILNCVRDIEQNTSQRRNTTEIGKSLGRGLNNLYSALHPLSLNEAQNIILMNAARLNIEYGQNITTAAKNIGMCHESFSRLFKKMYGIMPLDFQSLHANNKENPSRNYFLSLIPNEVKKILERSENWKIFLNSFSKKSAVSRQKLCALVSILMQCDIHTGYSKERVQTLADQIGITSQSIKGLLSPITVKRVLDARILERMISSINQAPNMNLDQLGALINDNPDAARLFFTKRMGVSPSVYRKQIILKTK